MLYQTLSAFSPISHYNHFNTKSTTIQIQTQTDSSYYNSHLNTNLVGGAGNYGSSSNSVNKMNGNGGAILLHQGQYNSLRSGFGTNNTTIHGNVNILLGGAMLSVVITILCIACYCCHRNIKKRTETAYRQRWLDNDDNMEIYSVEQCYESSGLFMTSNDHIPTLSHEPPPPYDAVILNEIANRSSPPPGYRSTNSINTNENFVEISTRKHQYNNYGDESPIQNNRILRNSQSVCSLERAQNQRIRIDDVNSIDTSSSSNQNSLYFDNNNNINLSGNVTANCLEQQFLLNKNINNSDGRTLYSKLRSNSSSNDSDLDILVNDIKDYNSDISSASFSVPSTSYCRQPAQINNEIDKINNKNDLHKLNIENNLVDLLMHEEQQHDSNNNNVENFTADLNPLENNNNNNNCLNLENIDENGVVRLDISQFIDTTGLPTYEAALKLESSCYV